MDHEPSRSRIHALGFIAMGSVLAVTVTIPVISLYLDRRGLPPAHVGAIIGAMSLTLVIAELLALGVSHLLGRRWTVVLGLAGSAVMFAWFPLARALVGLYLTRLVLGAVRGLLWPVLFAEVAEHGPPDRRGAQFSLFWLYFGIGLLFGPSLGGLLGERISLAAPFFAAAIASALTLPAAAAVHPVRDHSTRNPLALHAFLLRTSSPVTQVWMLNICNVTIFSVYATFLPLHAAAVGLTTAEIGLIFTAGAVAFILGQGLLGRIATRIPAAQLLVSAFLVRGLGVAAVPLLRSFPALVTVNLLSGVISAAIPLALSIRITAEAPREHLVAAMGGYNASADLGFFLGPLVGGIVAGFGLQWAFTLVIPVTVAALLLLRSQAKSMRSATMAANSRAR